MKTLSEFLLESLVVARKMPDGTIKYGQPGQVHVDLFSDEEIENLRSNDNLGSHNDSLGFAKPGGKFLTRTQAKKLVSKKEKPVYQKLQYKDFPDMHAHEYNMAKRLSEEFDVAEKHDHLEIKPTNYKRSKIAGTAIESRNNPHRGHADETVRSILNSPRRNSVFRAADEYSKKHLGKGYQLNDTKPESSLRKQYVIGKTHELASTHHPEYKKAVFEDYAKNRPDIVKETRAHDYDSLVKGSYRKLGKETSAQFDHMPVKMQFHDGHMSYHNSNEMLRDVHLHKNLTVFRGGDRHEHLHHTDKQTGLNENEKFRAVHDYFGHGIHGNSFGSKGEEIAWHSHKKMFSEGASVAMTSETRGQNSYVNFSHANLDTMKEMEAHRKIKRAALNRGDHAGASAADEKLREAGNKWNYAKQSAVALPSAMLKHDFDGHAPSHIAHLLHDPAAKRNKGVYDVDKDHLKLTQLAQHHNTKSHMALHGGGTLDRDNAHADLKHIAAVHGYHALSRNPF